MWLDKSELKVETGLIAGAFALMFSLFGTRVLIRALASKGYGQIIRDDGPSSHHIKHGTPTMGGIIFILAAILGYLFAHLVTGNAVTASALLVSRPRPRRQPGRAGKTGGNDGSPRHLGRHALGQYAGQVAGQAAARDVGRGLEHAGAVQRQQRTDIDPSAPAAPRPASGRGEGPGRSGSTRRPRSRGAQEKPLECTPEEPRPISTSPGAYVTRQRRALRPHRRRSPRSCPPRRHDTCRASRPSRRRRAHSPPGGNLGDAGDDIDRLRHIELAGREIIQEKQRLTALNGQIIHAHGDQVDADLVMDAGLDGEAQLGAHAIGRGNQHRVREARGLEVEQRAERAPCCPCGWCCARALIRSTSASPASISTPAAA